MNLLLYERRITKCLKLLDKDTGWCSDKGRSQVKARMRSISGFKVVSSIFSPANLVWNRCLKISVTVAG